MLRGPSRKASSGSYTGVPVVTPPSNAAARRLSGPLIVVLVLAVGIVYWVVNAQAQRNALALLQQNLTAATDKSIAANARADELMLEIERLRADVDALTDALERAREAD